jgi:CyaY protein
VISEAQYEELAEPELKKLLDAFDELETEPIDAELESGILTLEFSDDTRYVINSHRAARQIWMAAERSAWHFDWNPEKKRWIAEKTQDELWETLAAALTKKLGHPVRLVQAS